MKYLFEIKKILPKQEFMVVEYSSADFEDLPKFTVTLNPTKFDEEYIANLVHASAARAVDYWDRVRNHPETVSVSSVGAGAVEPAVVEEIDPNHQPIMLDPPSYDPFTQRIEQEPLLHPMQETVGWTVFDLTAEEQEQYLNSWRSIFFITPRQARLELAKRGQLSNIDTIIESLPADQQEVVQIEWEYAVSIERKSPWVIQLGSALGLDEVGLDELFKLAATL